MGRDARAQDPTLRFGGQIPAEVDPIYQRGLAYLASTQDADGSWKSGNSGCGVDGICVMAFLSSGEDPNYGRYAATIRRALRSILTQPGREDGLPARQHVPPRVCDASAGGILRAG